MFMCASPPLQKKKSGVKKPVHILPRESKWRKKKNTVLLLLLVHVEETMTSKSRRTICPISNAKTAKKKKRAERDQERRTSPIYTHCKKKKKEARDTLEEIGAKSKTKKK